MEGLWLSVGVAEADHEVADDVLEEEEEGLEVVLVRRVIDVEDVEILNVVDEVDMVDGDVLENELDGLEMVDELVGLVLEVLLVEAEDLEVLVLEELELVIEVLVDKVEVLEVLEVEVLEVLVEIVEDSVVLIELLELVLGLLVLVIDKLGLVDELLINEVLVEELVSKGAQVPPRAETSLKSSAKSPLETPNLAPTAEETAIIPL
jgi:hypothetical protein